MLYHRELFRLSSVKFSRKATSLSQIRAYSTFANRFEMVRFENRRREARIHSSVPCYTALPGYFTLSGSLQISVIRIRHSHLTNALQLAIAAPSADMFRPKEQCGAFVSESAHPSERLDVDLLRGPACVRGRLAAA